VANIQSQIKRNRQNETRRMRNKTVRSTLKTELKRFNAAASDGDRESAEQAFARASRRLDKAAEKGIVHRNYAANKKSRMAKKLAGL
jgi:small subunit ribosomal protein S20